MKILDNIKKGLLQGLGFVIIIGLSGVTYALALPYVSTNDVLTANIWNDLINLTNQNDANIKINTSKLTNISNDGANIGIGVTNPITKLDINGNINISGSIFQNNWTEITTFSNSWLNYGLPWNSTGFYKDKSGIVHLKGLIKSGTINAVAFYLPNGFRPSNYIHEVASTYNASGTDSICIIRIYTDGSVNIGNTCNSGWVSLESISFRAN